MKFLFVLLVSLFIASGSNASDDSGGVIELMGSNCKHGPVIQPNGHFWAFVFCDSALGSNLGIILSKLTNETDTTGVWGINKRFWQDGPWVTDMTSLAWDPFSSRLYVATAEVYGDGSVFVLDLPSRNYKRIYSIHDVDPEIVQNEATELKAESHFGFIETLNVEEKTITVSIRLVYGNGQSKVVGEKTIGLGSDF
ncbi:MAG: hypothetical protein JSU95_08825 [Betaproteobacteria bacterium]|nr:MAG: hypothetical protein JSU95_08825 [Betaproteobacteria bacterium]